MTEVYALETPDHTASYAGVTNDFARRHRQHNRDIAGGARQTARHPEWVPVFRVSGLPTRRLALQLEKKIQYGRGRARVSGPLLLFGPDPAARRARLLYGALTVNAALSTKRTVPTEDLILTISWYRDDLYQVARTLDWSPATVTHVFIQ